MHDSGNHRPDSYRPESFDPGEDVSATGGPAGASQYQSSGMSQAQSSGISRRQSSGISRRRPSGISRRRLVGGAAVGGAALVAGSALAGVPGSARADGRIDQSRTQTVAAKPSARKTELNRTINALSASDLRSTGYYLSPDTELEVQVVTKTADDARLVVGAPDADSKKKYRDPREYKLKPGKNTITDSGGGVIYYKVIGDSGYLRATLGEHAEPMPYFIHGTTHDTVFQRQLDDRKTPYVEMITERAMITIERDSALRYRNEDHTALLATFAEIIRIEDVDVSGMDGAAPRDARLDHPYHFVGFPGGIDGVGAYTTHGHMSYPTPIQDRLLTVQGLRTSGWGIYHELGHQHQQTPYKAEDMTEVTVNIYALAVNAAFAKKYGQVPRLHEPDDDTGLTPWQSVLDKIGTKGLSYFDDLDPYEKLVMFEQLRLSFDDFWPELHQLVRKEQPDGGEYTDSKLRHRNMVVLSSRAAGYDLIDFFTAWGFPVDTMARAEVQKLDLKKPPKDPTKMRDDEQSGMARRLIAKKRRSNDKKNKS